MPPVGERARRRAVAGLAVAAFGVMAAGLLGAAPATAAHAAAAPAAAGTVDAASLSTRQAPTATAAAADPSAPAIALYASGDGLLEAGADLGVSVVVTAGDEPIPAGQAVLSIATRPFDAASQLDGWLATSDPTGTRRLASKATASLPAHASMVVATITVPKAKLGLSGSASAVYGIEATVTAGGVPLGTATSAVVRHATQTSHVGVAVAMPITVPGRADGLISADDLASYTAPDGILTRELAAATGSPQLTLAIDPMILASIRVLGSSAPPSAQAWLTSLDELGSDSFALQYGDADVAAELQAGATKLVKPVAFDYALDPADHQDPLTVGEPDQPLDGGAPQPTQTAQPSTMPSMQQLLQWPYTLDGVAWPPANSVRGSDVATLAKFGLRTTIVSGDNTNASRLDGTADAPLPVATGGTALVADAGVSTALTAAYTAQTPAASGVALARLNAELALAAGGAQPGAVILATVDRGAPNSSAFASDAVRAVLTSPFTTSATLRDALRAPRTNGLEMVAKKESQSRVGTVSELLDQEGVRRTRVPQRQPNIAAFSTVLAEPALLRGPVRNQLLSLLSVAWTRPDAARAADDPASADAGDDDGTDATTPSPAATPDAATPPRTWSEAVAEAFTSIDGRLDAIQISSPGHVLQLSNQANIPIAVTNQLPYAVQIELRAVPSSPRVEIDSATDKTIPAGATVKVLIPVKSQVSNGTATLMMQLYSRAGVAIGAPAAATVQVHADWEGIGAAAFGVIVVGFFAFGIVRSVRRRRHERAGEPGDADSDIADPDAVDPDADAPHDAETPDDGR